ncbi:MAG TPA: 3',5'-cyclic-nucleotide phosphodiesterase [Gemmataceae bacterium]|nr:3',5'-cyclic-nucleotide phosphodiesterase [Gemmataceae bacterium]
MKLTLVPSAVGHGADDQDQFLSSYLLNDAVAIDAGCLGLFLTPEAQAQVKHVFISHSHIDHIASLPIFIENVYDVETSGVVIHGSDAVLESLRRDVFNNRVWPDFTRLPTKSEPFVKLSRFDDLAKIEVAGLKITPVPVNHVVPTHGFIVESAEAAIVIPSDTGPTEKIWECANQTPHLCAVFLEATFPNALAQLAGISKHLTPALFAAEIAKLKQSVPVYAVHLKARFRATLIEELRALAIPNLQIGKFGIPYEFGDARGGQ